MGKLKFSPVTVINCKREMVNTMEPMNNYLGLIESLYSGLYGKVRSKVSL